MMMMMMWMWMIMVVRIVDEDVVVHMERRRSNTAVMSLLLRWW